MKLISYRLL